MLPDTPDGKPVRQLRLFWRREATALIRWRPGGTGSLTLGQALPRKRLFDVERVKTAKHRFL